MLDKIIEYSDKLFDQLFARFIVAVIILLIGFIIGKLVGRLLNRLLHEIELDKVVKKAGLKFSLELLISHSLTYFIYFITIIWALNEIGLTTTILNMISAAALVVIIISFLLAIKDFLPNVIASFFINQRSVIKVGDKIKIDKLEGKVLKIGLIETEIKSKNGDIILIPNSSLIKKELIKKS